MEDKNKRKNIGLEFAFHRALLEGNRMRISKMLQYVDLSEYDKHITLKHKYKYSALIKAFIFRELKNIKSNPQLSRYLIKNKKEALQLGFYKNDDGKPIVPNRKTFDLYEKRLTDETRSRIVNSVETIRYNIERNCIVSDMDFDKPKRTPRHHALVQIFLLPLESPQNYSFSQLCKINCNLHS